jgi:hypothetical protein
MLARDVQELLPLLRRQAPPDVPRCQGDTDRSETSAEARHATILAQALLVVPFVVAFAFVFAVAVPVAVAVAAIGLLGLFSRLGRRGRCGHRRLVGFRALAVLVVPVVPFAFSFASVRRLARGGG